MKEALIVATCIAITFKFFIMQCLLNITAECNFEMNMTIYFSSHEKKKIIMLS